jgi:hypothetical protein
MLPSFGSIADHNDLGHEIDGRVVSEGTGGPDDGETVDEGKKNSQEPGDNSGGPGWQRG